MSWYFKANAVFRMPRTGGTPGGSLIPVAVEACAVVAGLAAVEEVVAGLAAVV
jgi:hypothetical protein